MAHVEFIAKHPGVPRLLFSELQRAERTVSKDLVQKFLKQYSQQLHRLFDEGKTINELDPDLDTEGAAFLFIGAVQGLIIQSLLAGKVELVREQTPRVFTIFRRGIRGTQ